jgi:hypothetical protein
MWWALLLFFAVVAFTNGEVTTVTTMAGRWRL